MEKVKFEDYKKVYERFIDPKKRVKRSDIKLVVDLINERSIKNGIKTKNI